MSLWPGRFIVHSGLNIFSPQLIRQYPDRAQVLLSWNVKLVRSLPAKAPPEVYPHRCVHISHVDVFLDNGYTKEELKMVNESRKIMGLPNFQASVTCVRVPVYRAHSVAVSAEFEKTVSIEEARAAIEQAPGIDLNDDVSNNGYPLPLNLAGEDNCQVGRIRKDHSTTACFWVVGDQLLKGAKFNAVQLRGIWLLSKRKPFRSSLQHFSVEWSLNHLRMATATHSSTPSIACSRSVLFLENCRTSQPSAWPSQHLLHQFFLEKGMSHSYFLRVVAAFLTAPVTSSRRCQSPSLKS